MATLTKGNVTGKTWTWGPTANEVNGKSLAATDSRPAPLRAALPDAAQGSPTTVRPTRTGRPSFRTQRAYISRYLSELARASQGRCVSTQQPRLIRCPHAPLARSRR